MLAFGLTLLVFFLFTIMGFSLAPKKFFEFDRSFALFISPAIGLVFSILFIFTFSRLGFPIKEMKIPFLIYFLTIVGIGIYRSKSLLISPRTLLKFSIAPIGVLFTAWPILKYGFSWISYVNDDMNNYVLGAMRFYNYGFFAKPNSALYSGSDYSQEYYFMHVVQGVRPGSELYLSAFSNLHDGNSLAIFMPAILTLQLILIFSTLAMSRTLKTRSKRKTRVTYLLAITLPLTSLGFLYQLIGQVGGLAIGVALIAVSIILFKQENYKGYHPVFFLLGIFIASQLIWYPELVPFIALPLIVKIGLAKKIQRKVLWTGSSFVLVIGMLALNKYFFQAVKFGASQILSAQMSTKGVNSNAQLFPYFLKPHGLPAFLGISPLSQWSRDPWESITVVGSIIILILVCFVILRRRLYLDLPIAIFLLIIGIFFYLVVKGNGFGAFKIAMYAEPFLIITFSVLLDFLSIRVLKRGLFQVIGFLILSGFMVFAFRTSEFYANASTGNSNNGFNEIPGASGVGIQRQIANSLKGYRETYGTVVSTAINLSQIKLEAIAANKIPLIFPTADVFGNISNSTKIVKANIGRESVTFKSERYLNNFQQPLYIGKGNADSTWYLESNNKYEAINHSKIDQGAPNWNYTLVKNPQNTLIFIDSSNGHSYYAGNISRQKEVIFQPEKNPMVPGAYMQSIGNNLLFEVVNPSRDPYLVLDVSNTVIPQYNRLLPRISILGVNQNSLPTLGRGSMHTYVHLVNPVNINGHKYFQLQVSQKLAPFPSNLSPISKFYGANIEMDSRRIALFATNISVIDGSEIGNLQAPSLVQNFPADLENPNLFYSGIYEDGWVSTDSFFDLNSHGKSTFSVSGLIPMVGSTKTFQTVVSISIDGAKVHSSKLSIGHFNETFHVENLTKSKSIHHVSIHFSNEQMFPKPDGRPAAAQITYLGFR